MGEYYESFDPPFFPNFDKAKSPLAKNAKGYDRADHDIQSDLEDRLVGLHGIDTSEVRVLSEHNVVTLFGTVAFAKVSDFLGALAANTLGVRAVVNQLGVVRVGAES